MVKLEEEAGLEIKWRFKALEHLVVLHFRQGDFDATIKRYNQMLDYISRSSVTRNESTSAINSVLEALTGKDASLISRVIDFSKIICH